MIIAPALRFSLHPVQSPPGCSLGHCNERRTGFGLTVLVHLGSREPSPAEEEPVQQGLPDSVPVE